MLLRTRELAEEAAGDIDEETVLIAERTWLLLDFLWRLGQHRLNEARDFVVERMPYRAFAVLMTVFALCALSSMELPPQELEGSSRGLGFLFHGGAYQETGYQKCLRMTKSYLTQQRQKLQSTLFMRQTRGRDADEWSKSVIDSLDHFVYAGHGRKSGLYRHEGPLAEPLDYSNLEVRLFGMGIVPAKRMNDALHELKASLGPTRLEVARHRSCAVVGGSGILKDARYGIQGTSIDSHEAVFRMNHHVPGSYASWVGNKTTYQLVYPEAWLIDGYDRNATVLFMPFSIHDLYFYIQSQSTNATKAESHTSRFRCWKQCPEGSGNEVGSLHWKMELSVLGRLNRAEVLMPSIRMAADHLLEGCRSQRGLFKLLYPTRTPKPSTGLMALILAYTICDSVTAYGFQGPRRTLYCHYEDKTPKSCHATHDLPYEWKLIQVLNDSGLVHVV